MKRFTYAPGKAMPPHTHMGRTSIIVIVRGQLTERRGEVVRVLKAGDVGHRRGGCDPRQRECRHGAAGLRRDKHHRHEGRSSARRDNPEVTMSCSHVHETASPRVR